MTYPNQIFTAFAFIGFLLVSIPFPWHLEAWNTGTCLYMAWVGLACLNQFINSIIWTGNAINWAPVWCDISSHFMIGAAIAIPACSLCINRRLYLIASCKTVTVTKSEKRRAVMVDLAIGLGIPILEMVLQYIPEGHRFNIYEDVGCYPFTYNTPVAYALVTVPPIAIGFVSAIYCVLSIRAFNKRRATFKELLAANNNLSSNRYFRLMSLAGIELLCTIPFGSYAVYLDSTAGVISPWKSFAVTHRHFHRVDQFPSIIWRNEPLVARCIEMSRWLVIVCAFIFFFFFGFADEARKNYRAAFYSVAKRVGYSTMGSGSTSFTDSRSAGIPNMSLNGVPISLSLPHQKSVGKRDSMDSFSDMSASFHDFGGALSDVKGKPLSPKLSFGAMSLGDAGGVLADYKPDPYSPTLSSGSSSSSFTSGPASPSDQQPPPLPEPAVTRDVPSIEISSVRGLSIRDSFVSPSSLPNPGSGFSPRQHNSVDIV